MKINRHARIRFAKQNWFATVKKAGCNAGGFLTSRKHKCLANRCELWPTCPLNEKGFNMVKENMTVKKSRYICVSIGGMEVYTENISAAGSMKDHLPAAKLRLREIQRGCHLASGLSGLKRKRIAGTIKYSISRPANWRTKSYEAGYGQSENSHHS